MMLMPVLSITAILFRPHAPITHVTGAQVRGRASMTRCAGPPTACAAQAGVNDEGHEYLLGPVVTHGATAWVERHPEFGIPRMCIVATDPPMTDAAIETFLVFMDDSLALEQPFTTFWDIADAAFDIICEVKCGF